MPTANQRSHLAELEAESIHIMREVVAQFAKPVDFSFTFGRLGTVTRHFFQVVLPASALAGLRLAEGSDMRSFLPSEILNLPRVVPYDSFAIWLHASGLLRQ